ncbi:MAG: alpha/beta hydrolase [Marinicellaceae bacterium]
MKQSIALKPIHKIINDMKLILKPQFFLLSICLFLVGCSSKINQTQQNKSISSASASPLIQHTVISDGHPMAVWQKKPINAKGVILFVHGRTWSGVPDFDLQVEGEDLSLMDGMVEQGYSTYAIDLRGYGETPRDSTEWNSPNKAVKDILNVLNWISENNNHKKIHLFGWSMGSTLSLLATQKKSADIASLTVFGYWQDLDVIIPEDADDLKLKKSINTAKNAASDFIVPGSISQKAIDTYVKMSLESDPIRADWRNVSQYNNIDPSLITTPTLILQGEFDPIGPTDKQAKLFTRLKTADKTWVVISGGDHAAFLEKPRPHFINSFTSFINRFNPQ